MAPDFSVVEVRAGDRFWDAVCGACPGVARWTADGKDDGSYHCFAAVRPGEFLGAAVIDVGPMGFGPLADDTVGFLEDIEVEAEHRRSGVGTALLASVLDRAWDLGALSVRWTVDSANAAGIGLYRAVGAAFVPDEDPGAAEPQKRYTVVLQRPAERRDPR